MKIELDIEEQDEHAKGVEATRALCKREVAKFDAYLRKYGGDYVEGLTRWERSVVEGYIYQKISGHIDELK